jgi:hypothetical protein
MSGCKIHHNRSAGRSNCPDPQTTFILPPKPFSILFVSLGSATWLYGLRRTVQPAARSSVNCMASLRLGTNRSTGGTFFRDLHAQLAVKRNTVQQTVRSSRTSMPSLRLGTNRSTGSTFFRDLHAQLAVKRNTVQPAARYSGICMPSLRFVT